MTDVSDDPRAGAQVRVGEATRAAVRALGFAPLGYVLMEHVSGFGYVGEVWRSPKHGVFATLSHHRGADVVGFRSLLEDGRFVVTERSKGGLLHLLTAYGARPPASSGYTWIPTTKANIADVFADHQAAVARICDGADAVAGSVYRLAAHSLNDIDMITYLGTRAHARAIGDARDAVCSRVEQRGWGFVPLLFVGGPAPFVVLEAWTGNRAWYLVAGFVALISFVVPFAARALIGPWLARRITHERVAVAELRELGRGVPRRALPSTLNGRVIPRRLASEAGNVRATSSSGR